MNEVVPIDISTYSQKATQHLLAGEHVAATALYEQLIEAAPETKEYYWRMGLALLLQGQEAEAQTTWMLAMVDGDTDQVSQWTADLAAILRSEAERQEKLLEKKTAWVLRQHLREVVPDDAINLLNLIQRSIEVETFTTDTLTEFHVIDWVRSAIAKDEIDWTLLLQVFKSLLEVAPLEPVTLEFAEVCLGQNPEPLPFIYALMNRAIELASILHKPDTAVQYVKLCLKVYPEELNLLSQLSYFYQECKRYEEGIEAAQKFCTVARALPDQIFGAFIMIRALMRAASAWDRIFAIFEHQDTLITELAKHEIPVIGQDQVYWLTTSTFPQPYLRDSLPQNRLNQNRIARICQTSMEAHHQEVVQRFRQGLSARKSHRITTKPLRIGYLSNCMRRHSVGWLSRWLIQYHNHDQFQFYGYFWNSQAPVRDPLQQWFMEHFDHSHLLGRESLDIANQIYQDEIDILIDLDSITADISASVMMLKPAPIQVTWLGWDASGIPAIDYFIADPYVLPDNAEAHYSEKIWRLPETYLAVDGFEVGVPTLRREQLGIPSDAIIYWSGQSSYKRHPATVRSQLQIIKAVPNSYLLVKSIADETSSIQAYFQQIAAEVGVDNDRLRFLPDVREEEVHRANLGIADVVLDTYPYNGATTTMETLWMGIPMVTRVGQTFSSRNSYGMMVNAGLTEGITWSEEEYVQWGIRLGTELELRQKIAWKLGRSRQIAPLWNARQFTRHMETAYEKMWQTYLNSSHTP